MNLAKENTEAQRDRQSFIGNQPVYFYRHTLCCKAIGELGGLGQSVAAEICLPASSMIVVLMNWRRLEPYRTIRHDEHSFRALSAHYIVVRCSAYEVISLLYSNKTQC